MRLKWLVTGTRRRSVDKEWQLEGMRKNVPRRKRDSFTCQLNQANQVRLLDAIS